MYGLTRGLTRGATRLGVLAALAAACVILSTGSSAAPLDNAAVPPEPVAAPASQPAHAPHLAPAPKPARGPTRGARAHVLTVEDYLLTVTNLDRSVAFYRDVIGLPLWRAAGTATANPLEQSLTNTPGARFRSAVFGNPSAGPALMLIEFTGIARRAQRPRGVDPGAATLQVQVHDLSRVLAAAARERTPLVTRGGRPLITGDDGAHDIVLRDPDGFYVLLSQLPLTTGSAPAAARASEAQPPAGNVVGLHVLYTVAAPVTLVRFCRNVLGLHVQAGAFRVDHTFDELFDAPGAQLAVMDAAPMDAAPETAEPAERIADALGFVAFRGVARHTYSGRPQDPGTPGFVLRVADLSAALRAIRASGTIVISAGGQPVGSGQSVAVLIRDPDGVLIQLVQRPVAPHRAARSPG